MELRVYDDSDDLAKEMGKVNLSGNDGSTSKNGSHGLAAVGGAGGSSAAGISSLASAGDGTVMEVRDRALRMVYKGSMELR